MPIKSSVIKVVHYTFYIGEGCLSLIFLVANKNITPLFISTALEFAGQAKASPPICALSEIVSFPFLFVDECLWLECLTILVFHISGRYFLSSKLDNDEGIKASIYLPAGKGCKNIGRQQSTQIS